MLMPLFPATGARPISGPMSRRVGHSSQGLRKGGNGSRADAPSSLRGRLLQCSLGVSLCVCLVVNLWLVMEGSRDKLRASAVTHRKETRCSFREYPPHRYYDWSRPLTNNAQHPSFLTDSEYIYGTWPTVLHSGITPPLKICVDQTSWLPPSQPQRPYSLPFADGTNPSIVAMSRLRQFAPHHYRVLHSQAPHAAYVATACMTNSQCTWPEPVPKPTPTVVLTVLLLLDTNWDVLHQATVTLERDAAWGKQRSAKDDSGAYQHSTPALDDARLFVHKGQLWISYREGPVFGYEAQVLNPVHISTSVAASAVRTTGTSSSQLQVHLKASETTSFCCGRNMALMQNLREAAAADNEAPLRALTWVDPVTVEVVDTTPLVQRPQQGQRRPRRRDLRQRNGTNVEPLFTLDHRRLVEKHKKSHIHGTNAFMVHMPDRREYLGIGHFHRPHGRAPNPYARFGHHYTHCFFTISDQEPYKLTGLSAEFLLPAAAQIHQEQLETTEMIQFLSGLEVVDHDGTTDRSVVIAYGINDCEAAITSIPWSTVESLLQPVHHDMGRVRQVIDTLLPLQH